MAICRDIYDIEKISKGPYDIWKINERLEATMYLVCGSEKACLIDTAYGLTDLKELTAELTGLPVTVINTHGHIDHVFGNRWFEHAMIHPADQALYQEAVDGFEKLVSRDWVREAYGQYLRDLDLSTVRFPVADSIREGHVIDLGEKRLEVIEVPGHTAGSIMLVDRDEKLCFAGDAIIEHLWLFLKESLPPEICRDSMRRAVQILKEAGVERIYHGHCAYSPLMIPDTDIMLWGMDRVCAGTACGQPFENMLGNGAEYTFGRWSVLCRTGAEDPT